MKKLIFKKAMHKGHTRAFYAYFYGEEAMTNLLHVANFTSRKRGYIIDLLFRLRYDIPALYFFKYLLKEGGMCKNNRMIKKRLN